MILVWHFDGDADRVGIVDETGEIIWADQLMALFLPEVIQNKGEEILYDVKCSPGPGRNDCEIWWKTHYVENRTFID